MKFGLYLADLRRSHTDSHGIINYAIGLATAASAALGDGEELFLLVGDEIRSELPPTLAPSVHMTEVPSPSGALDRLRLDHLAASGWARREGLDVVHFPKGHLPAVWPVRAATVATVHDDFTIRYAKGVSSVRGRLKSGYFARSTRHALRRAHRVITVSSFSAECLAGHVAVAGTKTVVIPNGVSLPLLHPKAKGDKDGTLLLLGSVLPHKRTEQAIGWTVEFLRVHPEFRLVVTGPLTPEAEALCRDPKIDRRTGVLSNLEIATLMRDAAAMLFPSVLEGFGLPPVEAACLGTPSVWAMTTALPEVMRTAPGGYIPDDGASFLAALEVVLALEDASLEQAAADFRVRYSWPSVAERTLEVYRSVAPAGNSR